MTSKEVFEKEVEYLVDEKYPELSYEDVADSLEYLADTYKKKFERETK